jgi:type II secretory pathway pseudopilin PulG
MPARSIVSIALTLLLLSGSGSIFAADDLKALQEQLALINQEQQAVYQQFQMIQQLRRSNAEPVLPPIGGGPPGNYDDMVASKRAQAERDEAYARELRDLYQRHQDLERDKQPILQRLRELRESPSRASGG